MPMLLLLNERTFPVIRRSFVAQLPQWQQVIIKVGLQLHGISISTSTNSSRRTTRTTTTSPTAAAAAATTTTTIH